MTDILIGIEQLRRIIAALILQCDNFLCTHTKDKCVFFANFFNVCSIHGSQSHSTVQHELHVTGSRSFFGSCGDLLRYICCCKDPLCVGYTIIFDKYYFQFSIDRSIIIDHISHRVDQLDGQLCSHISGSCFCTEDKGSRIEIHIRMLFDLVIQVHYMKDIHQLSLILMKSLNLYIKDGTRIDINVVVLFDIFCQTHFVLVFDIHELMLCFLIIHIQSQLFDLRQISDPLVTNMSSYPFCQQRIAVKQETSLGNTIGLVVELLRHHLVEIFQFLFLQDLCMKSCNTIYRISCDNCKMSHLNLTVHDNRHLLDFLIVARILLLNLINKSAVDLLYDLVNTRKQS